MSEEQGILDKAVHGIKGAYYEMQGLHPGSSPEWQRNANSEKTAKKAVINFLNTSSQEPSATFNADSASVFDLRQYEQGTILRVEYIQPYLIQFNPMYAWYVVGQRQGDKGYIYRIHYDHGQPRKYIDKNRQGDIRLFTPRPTVLSSFPVVEAHVVLSQTDPEDREEYVRSHPANKIDIMAMGKTSRARREEPSRIKPATQLATERASRF